MSRYPTTTISPTADALGHGRHDAPSDCSGVTAVMLTLNAALAIGPEMPPTLRRALVGHLTLANPAYTEAVRYGRSTAGLPETLTYYRRRADGALVVPAGLTRWVLDQCRASGVPVRLDDQTRIAAPVPFAEHVTLSAAQERAVAAALKRRYGVIDAPPGAGKTLMGLIAVARRRQPALWLTHTRELARQAVERAQVVLGLTPAEIGVVGDGQCRVGERLTVALVQTLARPGGIPPALLGVGHIVVDEAHHTPAEQMAAVVSQFPARYRLGLTATPYRRDGLDAVIGFHLGPVAARLDKAALAERLITPRVVKRPTGLRPWGDGFTEIVTALTEHPRRNRLIAGDVARAVRAGRRCLILSDRVGHVEALTALLGEAGIAAAALHGQQGKRARADVVARLNAGTLAAVVATGALVGEGFDCPRLDTLFLATPVSYAGRVRQYVGRVSRSAPGKRDALVFDYTDDHPMLWASWAKRAAVYRDDGLTIASYKEAA